MTVSESVGVSILGNHIEHNGACDKAIILSIGQHKAMYIELLISHKAIIMSIVSA